MFGCDLRAPLVEEPLRDVGEHRLKDLSAL
jgi:hypothetical protein